MREKIVAAAADLVLARGVGATTLDDIRAGTGASKSQLFHYFPGGKADLVKAIALFQGERVFDAQRPHLDELDTWSSWERWRDSVLAHYGAQAHWGCPIGAMVSELAGSDPELAAIPKRQMARWRRYLRDGLVRMRDARFLRSDADVEMLSWSTVASLQGGLLLTQTAQSLTPLRAALDGALQALRAYARPPVAQRRGVRRGS
jgi:AcrR family transcriptional regulator